MIPPVIGVCPVISATFHADGAIDIPGFRATAEMLIEAGVPSLMVFGVATENVKLTDDERERMLAALMEVRGNAPVTVVATVADHSTELAEQRVSRWTEHGVDVINILPSRFLDPPADEARRHLARLLEVSSLPVIIQYLPQAGSAVSLESMVELHTEYPSLRQIKVEQIPAAPAIRLVDEATSGSLTSLAGWGGLEWAQAVQAGAVGVQPGCSIPELYLRSQGHLDAGDVDGFESSFAPLRTALTTWLRHVEVLIAVEKHILMRREVINSDRCRHPSAVLTPQDYELADAVLSHLGSLKAA